jgi:hypothetical protein
VSIISALSGTETYAGIVSIIDLEVLLSTSINAGFLRKTLEREKGAPGKAWLQGLMPESEPGRQQRIKGNFFRLGLIQIFWKQPINNLIKLALHGTSTAIKR